MDWYKDPKGIYVHDLVGDMLRIEWVEDGKILHKIININELR